MNLLRFFLIVIFLLTAISACLGLFLPAQGYFCLLRAGQD
jgi:hypothetical protein